MTIIFILTFLFFIAKAMSGTGKGKTLPVTKIKPVPVKASTTSVSLFRSINAALFGEKALVVRLLRRDGANVQHETAIRVRWVNFTTCDAVDGLAHSQFLMVLADGKRLSLPITEKDGVCWVTYQGQRYNDWDAKVHTRSGLLEALQGDNRKVAPVWA